MIWLSQSSDELLSNHLVGEAEPFRWFVISTCDGELTQGGLGFEASDKLCDCLSFQFGGSHPLYFLVGCLHRYCSDVFQEAFFVACVKGWLVLQIRIGVY